MELPPIAHFQFALSRYGKSDGTSDSSKNMDADTTKVCVSNAYSRTAASWSDRWSGCRVPLMSRTVAPSPAYAQYPGQQAACTSSPSVAIAALSSVMWFSKQISPPSVPNGVSNTRRSLPSPRPQKMRSWCVGINLRCRPRISPSGPKKIMVL